MNTRSIFTALAACAVVIAVAGSPPGLGKAFAAPATTISVVSSETIDGGWGLPDEPRGIALGRRGQVYATGYVSRPGQGRNIWLARFNSKLTLQVETILDGPASADDEGYAIALGNDGFLYVIGYITDAAEDHNVWIGKFDADLALQDETIVNGSANSTDDGYGLITGPDGLLYAAGTLTETGEGYNIWVARYDTSLNQLDEVTLNGPADNTDKGRFLAFDDSGNLFVSGSMTRATTGYDIWLGKLDENLDLITETVLAGPTAEEDKGYGIVFRDGVLYATGTMNEVGQSYNTWLAKFDTDLDLIDSITIDGPVNGEDVSYSIALDARANIYQTGAYTEAEGGTNVWVAVYTSDLVLKSFKTFRSPGDAYDTGLGIVKAKGPYLYLSATLDEGASGGLNIWLARLRVGHPPR